MRTWRGLPCRLAWHEMVNWHFPTLHNGDAGPAGWTKRRQPQLWLSDRPVRSKWRGSLIPDTKMIPSCCTQPWNPTTSEPKEQQTGVIIRIRKTKTRIVAFYFPTGSVNAYSTTVRNCTYSFCEIHKRRVSFQSSALNQKASQSYVAASGIKWRRPRERVVVGIEVWRLEWNVNRWQDNRTFDNWKWV